MKFCCHCSASLTLIIPDGDNRERFVCPSCNHVHYQNPLTVVGCVAEWDKKILLCRRAIEPRRGYWTVPAGFMENDETASEGAARETREEALAEVTTGSLLALVDVVHARQIHLFFRGTMNSADCGVGEESLETRLIDEADIPWDDIAFPSVEFAMRRYLADRALGVENLHTKELKWRKRVN